MQFGGSYIYSSYLKLKSIDGYKEHVVSYQCRMGPQDGHNDDHGKPCQFTCNRNVLRHPNNVG